MKKLNIFYCCTICALLYSLESCKKFVDIGSPKSQLTATAVFADSTNANAAVVGIYENMMQGGLLFCSGGLTLYPGLSSDELNLTGNDATAAQFFNNQLLSNNSVNQALWFYAYKYIYQTNACIEGIAASGNLSPGVKSSLSAESRFLRAFFYFNLVNLYGPVPLITGTNYEQNRLVPRTSTDEVYAQIIADLVYAQANLSANTLKERANYYAATALLAKTYLYTGQYAAAVTESDKIITSGKYALVSNLNNVFLSASTETIWDLLPVVPLHATWEGFYFVPSSANAKPRYTLTNTLYNFFESGDLRKASWTKANTVAGLLYPFSYKYKIATTSSAPAEYSIVFRLAEIYLIRAEAKAKGSDIAGAAADLNMVRKRAGLTNTTANDMASMLLAIEKERQAELFCEWGNRWFDLKRTGRAAAVLTSKPNLNVNSLLFPIPLSELNANPNLIQNPGY